MPKADTTADPALGDDTTTAPETTPPDTPSSDPTPLPDTVVGPDPLEVAAPSTEPPAGSATDSDPNYVLVTSGAPAPDAVTADAPEPLVPTPTTDAAVPQDAEPLVLTPQQIADDQAAAAEDEALAGLTPAPAPPLNPEGMTSGGTLHMTPPPYIGAIVHYYDNSAADPLAAIITKIWPGEGVSLTVFRQNITLPMGNIVPYAGDLTTDSIAWRWPPAAQPTPVFANFHFDKSAFPGATGSTVFGEQKG